ncbi:DNA-directed RNA polymerase subunit beta [Vibrio alginolyticus]|uniref:DNA-directed RNA polymerase subunit beta n=1 Tax=Vibrio alginolyticus TaxID=663 RepID=UPI00211A8D74|nr:DNA-directed RNA polymerase subunit beta [Vibrio alginolyticus]MCQ9104095.1 DNA-directed RNA polymerase subunit beta [Vibrio alginolyticus]
MNNLKTRLLLICFFPVGSLAQASENIADYLQEQSKHQVSEDFYAQPTANNLNLDAKTNSLTWHEDGKPDHCRYAKQPKDVATHFDYGEANDLSDGLQHFDLPERHSAKVKSTHRTYTNNPHLLPGNKQFAAPEDGTFSLSVSSDCF